MAATSADSITELSICAVPVGYGQPISVVEAKAMEDALAEARWEPIYAAERQRQDRDLDVIAAKLAVARALLV